MSNTPIQVTTDLGKILERIEQKIDKLDEKFETKRDTLDKKVETKLDKIDERLNRLEVNRLEVGQTKLGGDLKALETKVGELGKQIDDQKFINCSVLIGLIVTILGGAAKLFGLVGNP
ncbi:hemolytic enterotoxin [Hydrococcus rivularis NIES-593]|uniref:Hemolytic enterotoxin n=1 Tax=Hydrococcus rivularis NIES-593 TaxID=1921803 RepID=A0A1U7HGV7_9CYAN|nr:hemolytic enterotoxin [Hydrococcus rivularis]OKH22799.1 hemolytic enterotoxin [Hydrococcus rivularis NIES-593]